MITEGAAALRRALQETGRALNAGAVIELAARLKKLEAVVEAARKIKHWHDAGDGGMVVSRAAVFELWDALEKLDVQEAEQPK